WSEVSVIYTLKKVDYKSSPDHGCSKSQIKFSDIESLLVSKCCSPAEDQNNGMVNKTFMLAKLFYMLTHNSLVVLKLICYFRSKEIGLPVSIRVRVGGRVFHLHKRSPFGLKGDSMAKLQDQITASLHLTVVGDFLLPEGGHLPTGNRST
ncbi:hypothetical protein GIB67_003720, partial [Kingdonia uniflora]